MGVPLAIVATSLKGNLEDSLDHSDYDFSNMSLTEFAMLFEPFYQKMAS